MDTRTQVKQYVDIAWRRKWWLVIPVAVGAAASLYYYKSAPKLYRATTTILVTRQTVPEDIVRTVTTRVDEQMKQLTVQIFSQTYMEKVAREFGLIEDNADERTKERVCAQIRHSVKLDLDKRDFSWFQIMVSDSDPQRAAKVANRLAEMFIDQNTESRVRQASENTNLIGGWVTQADTELRKRDAEISRFKREHMYELPDQQDTTLQLISVSRDRVSHLSSEIQSKSDRLTMLQSEDKANRAAAAAAGITAPGDDPDSRQLAQLQRELNELLVSYTDENPLVRRKRDQINQFKALYPNVTATKTSGAEEPQTSPEAKRLQLELRNLQADRAHEEAQLRLLTTRLANIPLRAQELENLTRGYDVLKKDYETRAGQKQGARRSQEVEVAKKGQQFQVQDQAYAPAVPFEPVLFQVLLMGIAAGAGVGVGITVLLEFLDQSVRGEEQFADLFPDVPILGSIPNLIATAPVKPHAKKVKKVAAGVIVALAVLGGLLA